MKGATADDSANSMRSPKRSKVSTMGIIHHSFLSHKNTMSSFMIPSLRPAESIAFPNVLPHSLTTM